MTMQELNFSLLVEQMLSKIIDPAYRQIMVEAFMVVSTILQRNPELVFHQSVNMDKVQWHGFVHSLEEAPCFVLREIRISQNMIIGSKLLI